MQNADQIPPSDLEKFSDLFIVSAIRASGPQPVQTIVYSNGRVHWDFYFKKSEVAEIVQQFHAGQLFLDASLIKRFYEASKRDITSQSKLQGSFTHADSIAAKYR